MNSLLTVSINEAVLARGTSGTAVVVAQLRAALESCGVAVKGLRPKKVPDGSLARAAHSLWWDFFGCPRAAGQSVLLAPANTGRSALGNRGLVYVHDTMVLDRPEYFDRRYANYARAAFGPSVRLATRILTGSRYSRDRIAARWPASAGKIRVLDLPAPEVRAEPRLDLPRGECTVLMVGATEPHKRHCLGLEVVRLLRLATRRDIRLKVVGPAGRAEWELQASIREADPSGTWITRHVEATRAELGQAYADAWLLLQTSVDEGLCLPLLEAAAHALPVVHSGQGAMTEVHPAGAHGDAPHELCAGMMDLLLLEKYQRASSLSLVVAENRPMSRLHQQVKDLVLELAAKA